MFALSFILLLVIAGLCVAIFQLRSAARMKSQEALAKARFLTCISQEMRTPMSGLIGMTNLLLSTGLSGDQEEIARHVEQSAELVLQQVSDLIDYARLDEGSLQLEVVDFDAHGLLEDVAEHYSAVAKKNKLTLISWVSPQVPGIIRGDAVRLRQVLNHLLQTRSGPLQMATWFFPPGWSAKPRGMCRSR